MHKDSSVRFLSGLDNHVRVEIDSRLIEPGFRIERDDENYIFYFRDKEAINTFIDILNEIKTRN